MMHSTSRSAWTFCSARPTVQGILPTGVLTAGLLTAGLLAGTILAPGAQAQDGCPEPSTGPDVIVSELSQLSKLGTVGQITSYSLGTISCNVGDTALPWIYNTPQHPVIAQNIFRVENGAIQQLGQSWLTHGLSAQQLGYCCDCIPHIDSSHLGAGCSDPISAQGSSVQGGMGPRSEVDPFTGEFPYPFSGQGSSGDALYKRLQVENSDLDPLLHPDALFIAEAQYVTPDDAAAGNQHNNSSYRRIAVGELEGSGYLLDLVGNTRRELPGIFAWQEVHDAVQLNPVSPPGEGIFWVGSHVEYLGGGTWRYEYAVQNVSNERGADRLEIPFPPGTIITDVTFHDVDHHSGEPFDGTDWSVDLQATSMTWSTQPHSVDPNSNALRWGTLYGFGFTANLGPLQSTGKLGLFKPGNGASIDVPLQTPGDDCLGSISSFCPASPNSYSNGGALLQAQGSTSVALDDLTLYVNFAVPNGLSLFFYGPDPDSTPFGDGTRCVTRGPGLLVRLGPPQPTDFFGYAARELAIGQPPVPSSAITPGTTWYFQCWYQDPGGTAGFNLSNALEITFCQ